MLQIIPRICHSGSVWQNPEPKSQERLRHSGPAHPSVVLGMELLAAIFSTPVTNLGASKALDNGNTGTEDIEYKHHHLCFLREDFLRWEQSKDTMKHVQEGRCWGHNIHKCLLLKSLVGLISQSRHCASVERGIPDS